MRYNLCPFPSQQNVNFFHLVFLGVMSSVRTTPEAGGPEMETGERYAVSSWKHNHLFEFVSTQDDNVRVLCILCAGGNRILTTSKNSTSNLKKKNWTSSTAQ